MEKLQNAFKKHIFHQHRRILPYISIQLYDIHIAIT